MTEKQNQFLSRNFINQRWKTEQHHFDDNELPANKESQIRLLFDKMNHTGVVIKSLSIYVCNLFTETDRWESFDKIKEFSFYPEGYYEADEEHEADTPRQFTLPRMPNLTFLRFNGDLDFADKTQHDLSKCTRFEVTGTIPYFPKFKNIKNISATIDDTFVFTSIPLTWLKVIDNFGSYDTDKNSAIKAFADAERILYYGDLCSIKTFRTYVLAGREHMTVKDYMIRERQNLNDIPSEAIANGIRESEMDTNVQGLKHYQPFTARDRRDISEDIADHRRWMGEGYALYGDHSHLPVPVDAQEAGLYPFAESHVPKTIMTKSARMIKTGKNRDSRKPGKNIPTVFAWPITGGKSKRRRHCRIPTIVFRSGRKHKKSTHRRRKH